MNSFLKNNQGSTILLITFMVMSSMLFASLALSDIVINGLKMAKTQADSTLAHYAAESAAEMVLWEIRENGLAFSTLNAGSPCIDPSNICFDADGVINGCKVDCLAAGYSSSFTLTSSGATGNIEYELDGTDIVLLCIGTYRDTRRAIKIRY